MTRKELEKTVETLEAVHADTLQNSTTTATATASHAEQPTTAAERIGAALGGLAMLGARVSVYVPATCGTADAADNSREVDAVASTLSAWFGGATIQPGAGCWMSDTCGLVKEDTTLLQITRYFPSMRGQHFHLTTF